jgi:hypothetical protein
MDMYIPTKFHGFFWVTFVQSGKKKKLPIIATCIYDARYHAHPYTYTKYYRT